MSTMTIDSPAEGAPPVAPTKLVAATVAGNALEFYDFVTYSFFAVYIGQAFFKAQTPFMSLLLSVAVFGVGFVTPPGLPRAGRRRGGAGAGVAAGTGVAGTASKAAAKTAPGAADRYVFVIA